MKLYHFTVRGNGAFPTDMLRYDACWPSDQDSVNAMHEKSIRNIRLTSHREPTEGRWNSFWWNVLKVERA